MMSEERLQKILARAGHGSRRACEELIVAGRVTVNGEVVSSLGAKADPKRDDIRCDGERVREERKVYLLVNKPRGYVCSSSDELGRASVIDLLRGVAQRVYTVGRLDRDSEGLVIVTNDGEFANLLSHPRYEVPKTYLVELNGLLTEAEQRKLARGIHPAGGRAKLEGIEAVKGAKERSLLKVTLREGRDRQIGRVLAGLGYRARRLRRVKIGSISDERLKPGKHRRLERQEIDELLRLAGGGEKVDAARER